LINPEITELKQIVRDLLEAQKVMEEDIREITLAQKKTDEKIISLSTAVKNLQEDFSGIMKNKDVRGKDEKPTVTPASERDVSNIVSSVDGAEMLLVPAGDFWMGDDDPKHADEQPVHKVFLKDYYVYIYPVTNFMYCKFLNAIRIDESVVDKWIEISDEYCKIYVDNGAYRVREGYESYPVVCVSWHGADAYARWAGKRLPTEAEWEKAARGTDRRIYPWGNEWDKGKCANPYSSGKIMPAGSYPEGSSPYGIMDMAGNVWEWCSDWYDETYYGNKTFDNPTGPPSGKGRVIRGGSWNNDARACRCSNRNSFPPENRNYILGFRCVK